MTTEQTKAKGVIEKLLALAARPGTPAEGETARAKAEALARKHGLVIRKRQPSQARSSFSSIDDFLRYWERQTDRAGAEQQAADAARRARQEERRKATSYRRYMQRGYQDAQAGRGRWDYPFERNVVFGVDIRRAWREGHDAYTQRRTA